MIDPSEKVLIVGAGTFGLSTGLYLLRQGHTNVHLIDIYDVPSDISAGNDINKIIQSSYTDLFHQKLAREAVDIWLNDPLFKKHYHEVGIIYAGSTPEAKEELDDINNNRILADRLPLEKLNSKSDFQKVVPSLSGDLKGWFGYYQDKECGWAHARNTLLALADEIIELGGIFHKGEVNGLIVENNSVVGCTTKEGINYQSDKIVIAAGASSIKVLDFEDQMEAKCWTFAHIKVTDEEAAKLKNIPVVLNTEEGFFFEPDSNNEIKICNEHPGYTNFKSQNHRNPESSIPISKDSIPIECEEAIRKIFKETIPEFADREFVKKKICWCTDTPDRCFLIDNHPKYDNNSLILATGDSGHGFKFVSNVGKYISELILHGEISNKEMANKWRWRPETSKDRVQDRLGGSGEIRDLSEVKTWI